MKEIIDTEEKYARLIKEKPVPCIVGTIGNKGICNIGESKKGGLPDVGSDFTWPQFKGKYLDFLAQIECKYFGRDFPGVLQFFCSANPSGYNRKDSGSFRVIYQKDPVRRASHLPSSQYKKFFFFERVHSPNLWDEELLQFRKSISLPPFDRLDVSWDCDFDDLYGRKLESLDGFIRIGGFPNPIQSDDMEETCSRNAGIPSRDSWKLLAQISGSVAQISGSEDMMWGDGGKLYWFIDKVSLENWDFSNIWMVCQSH